MDNNEILTPENTTPQQPEAATSAPVTQQSPFAQPAAPVSPVEAPPQPPVVPESSPVVPEQPAAQPDSGMNTAQSLSQPAPTQPAFVPPTTKIQVGGATATREDENSKAHRMREVLHAQRKVPIMIPLNFGERPGTMHPFGINGYFYYVQKGVMVEVPEQIANMAIESFNLDYNIGASIDLSKNEDKQRNL